MAVSRKVILWAGFSLSILSSILIGFDLSFNVYAIALKETFNFTQTQAEIVASMSTIGLGLSFLQRVSLETLGLKCTFVLIWLLTPTASALYAMATHFRYFFHNWFSLICIIQLILSTGMSTTFVMVTSVSVENLPRKHSGKIVGVYCAFIAVGTLCLAAIFDVFFRDNLGGFFLSICVSSLVVFGVCLAVLYCLTMTVVEETEKGIAEPSVVEEAEKGNADLQPSTPIYQRLCTSEARDQKFSKSIQNGISTTPRSIQDFPNNNKESFLEVNTSDVLKSLFFHGIFWSSCIFFGATYTCLNDLTALARSIELDNPFIAVYVVSVTMFVTRLLFGVLFDHYFSEICGVIILMVGYLGFIIGMGLGMLKLDSSSIITVAILIGLSQGIAMIVPVSIIIFRFGRVHYGAVINAFFTVSGICQIIFQVMSGYLYDREIVVLGQSGIYCHGPDCFHGSFIMFFVIGIVFAVVQVLSYLIDLYKGRK